MKNETAGMQAILKVAEELFLERGYAGTTMSMIKQRAGVSHALIFYHFESKEKLFSIIFKEKVELLASSFFSSVDTNKSVSEIIETAVGRHFDFVRANPRDALFILAEMNSNTKSQNIWREISSPITSELMAILKAKMQREIAEGKIANIDPLNYLLTLLSLNIFPFIARPLVMNTRKLTKKQLSAFLEERKRENVRLALLALQP